MYFFSEKCLKMLSNPIEGPKPNVMMSETQPTLEYTNPSYLATSGIYSQADFEKSRDHIMFDAVKHMVLNTSARIVTRQPTNNHDNSVLNFLDREAIDKIVQSTWDKF